MGIDAAALDFVRMCRQRKDDTPQQVLDRIGYAEGRRELTEASMSRAIKERPQAMDEWATWSEDNRSGEGWSVAFEEGWYVVAFSSRAGESEEHRYRNKVSAYAYFILHALEYVYGLRPKH